MAAPILQFKRGAFVNLPGLRAGEPALTNDTFDLYVGIDSTTGNNKFFGSHRYWTKETATTGSGIRFVERTDGGSNYIELKAPDTALAANVTYVLPGSQGSSSTVLTNDGSGNLSWASASSSQQFSGINTFTDTTDNTLGNENTGSVQLDGGMGIAKNLTVKQNLHVGGFSEFVGVVTFRGGTINIGDGNTDNINVGGEFISGLAPSVDNTYDIGISTQKWKDAYFSGIGSFATGAYIAAIRLGITATNEIDTTSGNLVLDSAAGTVEIQDNLTVSGIATITGAFVANGNVTLGDTSGDTITINGTTTFNQPLVGTIGTATRATLVDTTTAPSGTFYPGLFVNNTGTASTAVYVDSGISYVSNTDTLALTGDIAVNGGDVTTSATAFNLVNGTATNVNFAGAATALVMGAATGIATINNATLTLPNATAVNVNGANPTLASSSTGTLTLFNTNLTGVNAFGAGTAVQIGAATGITTIRNSLRVTNSLYDSTNNQGASGQFLISTVSGIGWTTISGVAAGTISTATRATTVDTIGTSDGSTYFLTFADTSAGQQGETLRVSVGASYIPSTNKLSVTTLSGSNIQAADGTTALTITNSTGAVATNANLTVGGDLFVNGSTTQVNTTALTVEDRTIDLGIVDGVAPTTATTWDLGILFNYFTDAAKKSAVVWEHADTRFKFASVVGADTNGTTVDTPQLTVTTFAPIEIASLWVNGCGTLGAQEIIKCDTTQISLLNITVDAGTF